MRKVLDDKWTQRDLQLAIKLNTNCKLASRWASDFKVPIQVRGVDYTAAQLNRIGEYAPSKIKALEWLVSEEEKGVRSIEEIVSEELDVRDRMITDIVNSQKYKEFCEMDMNEFGVSYPVGEYKVYCKNYDRKYVVSIDLVKANYQVMRKLGVIEFNGTWEEYVGQYTDSEYVAKSKYFRQVVFGKCCPKRQTTVEKYYMNKVRKLIENRYGEKLAKLIAFYNDELLYETDGTLDKEYFEEVARGILFEEGIEVDIEVFEVEYVSEQLCIKHFINKEGFEIMNTPQNKFMQALAYVYNREPDEYDMLFVHDGRLAEYKEPEFSRIGRYEKWK